MISMNKLFKKHIQFVQYGRSGSILITKKKDVSKILQEKGWILYKNNNIYRLNPPSVNLVDISDINKINQYNNPLFNFVLFKYLKKKIEKNNLKNFIDLIVNKHKLSFKNFAYHISCGPALNFAVKIEGSDERINNLQFYIVEEILNNEDFKKMYRNYFLSNSKNIIFNKASICDENIDLYNRLSDLYNIKKKLDYNIFEYCINYNGFSFEKYDYILLILNGCFKFIQFFDIKSIFNKLVFWEIHLDKNKGEDKICKIKLLKNKKILLVDSLYSGSTIKYIKKILNPISNKVEVLGIFPKSESVYNLCDYVLLGNKVFKCEDLKKYSFIEDYLILL